MWTQLILQFPRILIVSLITIFYKKKEKIADIRQKTPTFPQFKYLKTKLQVLPENNLH